MTGSLELFAMFFPIGIFGFGGGYAMLPLIYQRVQASGLMTYEEFSNLVAISQVTPGPIAVNAATYVGFIGGGVPGAAAATIGVALPSFVLVLAAMALLSKFKESKGLKGMFSGVRPAVVGLVASAAVFVGGTVLIEVLPWAIFLCTIILVGKFKMNPIAIIIAMGTVGAFLCG
jgi:chromate transporter